MKKQLLNYQSGKTRTRYFLSLLVFLCALCAFAGNARGQSDIDFFAETIAHGTTEQKRDALARIRNLQDETYSRLAVPALQDKAEIVRATAAFSVIFLPKDEAVAVLSPLLNDKKELVRREAAYALGKVASAGALNFLLGVLRKDKISEVRAASVIALGEIGDTSAVNELVKILQRKSSAKEEFVRRSAARSIGQIAQIIQTNERDVSAPKDFLPAEYFSNEKPNYPKLIETFPIFRNATNVLIQTLQNPKEFDDVKREAAFALGAIGDASAIPILQANLNAKDYYQAKICNEALKKIALAKSMLEN